MEHDSYRLWEVLGVWASAVGTIAAVVTSLWLARRSDRENLVINADMRVLVDGSTARDPGKNQRGEMKDIISIEATNLGSRPIRINSIGWHWAWIRRPGAIQNPPVPQFRSHGMPASLQYGEQLQWALTDIDVLDYLAEHMLSHTVFWPLKLRLLRVLANTSTDNHFRGKVGPELSKELAERTRSIRASRQHR